MTDRIPVTSKELAELFEFSATSGEAIAGKIPGPSLVRSQTGSKTLQKLAEMRGVEVSEI